MKLVNSKCPNCGAQIDFKKGETKTTCEYCKSIILLDDEVLKVEIVNNPKLSGILKVAEMNFKNGDYSEAYHDYKEALTISPDNNFLYLRLNVCKSIMKSDSKYAVNTFKEIYAKDDDYKYIQEMFLLTNILKLKNNSFSEVLNIYHVLLESAKTTELKIRVLKNTLNELKLEYDRQHKLNTAVSYQMCTAINAAYEQIEGNLIEIDPTYKPYKPVSKKCNKLNWFIIGGFVLVMIGIVVGSYIVDYYREESFYTPGKDVSEIEKAKTKYTTINSFLNKLLYRNKYMEGNYTITVDDSDGPGTIRCIILPKHSSNKIYITIGFNSSEEFDYMIISGYSDNVEDVMNIFKSKELDFNEKELDKIRTKITSDLEVVKEKELIGNYYISAKSVIFITSKDFEEQE